MSQHYSYTFSTIIITDLLLLYHSMATPLCTVCTQPTQVTTRSASRRIQHYKNSHWQPLESPLKQLTTFRWTHVANGCAPGGGAIADERVDAGESRGREAPPQVLLAVRPRQLLRATPLLVHPFLLLQQLLLRPARQVRSGLRENLRAASEVHTEALELRRIRCRWLPRRLCGVNGSSLEARGKIRIKNC